MSELRKIYSAHNPATGEVVHIGWSIDPAGTLAKWAADYQLGTYEGAPLIKLMRKLAAAGGALEIRTIKEGTMEEAKALRQAHILAGGKLLRGTPEEARLMKKARPKRRKAAPPPEQPRRGVASSRLPPDDQKALAAMAKDEAAAIRATPGAFAVVAAKPRLTKEERAAAKAAKRAANRAFHKLETEAKARTKRPYGGDYYASNDVPPAPDDGPIIDFNQLRAACRSTSWVMGGV